MESTALRITSSPDASYHGRTSPEIDIAAEVKYLHDLDKNRHCRELPGARIIILLTPSPIFHAHDRYFPSGGAGKSSGRGIRSVAAHGGSKCVFPRSVWRAVDAPLWTTLLGQTSSVVTQFSKPEDSLSSRFRQLGNRDWGKS
jgi:hypothetical protein